MSKNFKEKKSKIAFIIGTRPEAIKLAPGIKEFKKSKYIDTKVLLTGQHKDMVDNVLNLFDFKADFNLNVMTEKQSLAYLSSIILEKIMLKQLMPSMQYLICCH